MHCCAQHSLQAQAKKGSCQSTWEKMPKSSQFHLICIYQTCSCSQQNWRSRDCSYSWEKGTISLKDSGSLSSPPGASQPLTALDCHVCPGLYCLNMIFILLSLCPSEAAAKLSPISVAHPLLSGAPFAVMNTGHPADSSV